MENKLKIVLATSNPHKVSEINEIAKAYNIEFTLPKTDNFDPDETGVTFMENARIKATEASKVSEGEYFMADDSGLMVDFLKGAPGIYSARYEKTPERRIEKLLGELKNADDRHAKFVCAVCLVNKNAEILYETTGEVKGEITHAPKGKGGFGYDPVFLVNGLNKTMAELSQDEKNTLSHRGQAVKNMLEWLSNADIR